LHGGFSNNFQTGFLLENGSSARCLPPGTALQTATVILKGASIVPVFNPVKIVGASGSPNETGLWQPGFGRVPGLLNPAATLSCFCPGHFGEQGASQEA
jgi:hypothetical protein